jgi:hypothetical protein
MSIVFPCIAARNMLRLGLTNFYDSVDSGLQDQRRATSIKIMPDERPAPNCGREFLAIFCSAWNAIDGDSAYALHEEFEITVAITQRAGDVPFDRLGEALYLRDEDTFIQQYYSIEQRAREVVKVIHPDYAGYFAQINSIAPLAQQPYDKLWLVGADSRPTIVGPDHFFGEDSSKSPTGFLWKVRFKGSGQLNWMTTIDDTTA